MWLCIVVIGLSKTCSSERFVMSKSSEDVLLVVSHVKNKKCDGTLYMMSERMAWMPATKETFTISYNYVDIKGNKSALDFFICSCE